MLLNKEKSLIIGVALRQLVMGPIIECKMIFRDVTYLSKYFSTAKNK